MADIESGIVESKNLHVLGVCSKWAGWALHVADGWWDFLSLLLRWWSRIFLQWFAWRQPPACQCGRPRAFRSLTAQPSLGSMGRAGDTPTLACNGNRTRLAGMSGDWPDWPVSDHSGRRNWKQHRSGEGGEGPLRVGLGPMV